MIGFAPVSGNCCAKFFNEGGILKNKKMKIRVLFSILVTLLNLFWSCIPDSQCNYLFNVKKYNLFFK